MNSKFWSWWVEFISWIAIWDACKVSALQYINKIISKNQVCRQRKVDVGREPYWKNAEHLQDHQCFQWNHNKIIIIIRRRGSYKKNPTTWNLLIVVLLEVTNSVKMQQGYAMRILMQKVESVKGDWFQEVHGELIEKWAQTEYTPLQFSCDCVCNALNFNSFS